ncbi:MAG: M15 family metallopeptidase [Anaerovoracaceae bacterium]|jgi:hypothetical protein
MLAVTILMTCGMAIGQPLENPAGDGLLAPTAAVVYQLPVEKAIKKPDHPKKYFRIYKIRKGDKVYRRISGKSYQPSGSVPLSSLRYIRVLHYDFKGKIRTGEIIVNEKIAGSVKSIFYQLYQEKYQIRSMRLVDHYWVKGKDGNAADYRSVEADNTSAFNYRTISHRSTLSNHAEGLAIDLNPRENPYVGYRNGTAYAIDHPNLDQYASGRSSSRAHMITTEDKAYRLFTSYGFTWGGSWSGTPDYQHFEHP